MKENACGHILGPTKKVKTGHVKIHSTYRSSLTGAAPVCLAHIIASASGHAEMIFTITRRS